MLEDGRRTPPGYEALGGGVLVRAESAAGLADIDTLIFDMDGVIIDPTGSIERSHPPALQLWAETVLGLTEAEGLIGPADTAEFRLAGGFNDDWNIAAAAALVYAVKKGRYRISSGRSLKRLPPSLADVARASRAFGAGTPGVSDWLRKWAGDGAYESAAAAWDPDLVMEMFMEVVSGPDCLEMYGFRAMHWPGPGRIANDRLLVTPEQLRLPYALGVYTGRTLGEVHVGLRVLGMSGWLPDDLIISANQGMPKPDGRPLKALAGRLGMGSGAFMGDNPDDLRSVLMYRELEPRPMYGVQVCFGEAPDEAREVFVQMGADMIAPDTASALSALAALREGGRYGTQDR